MKAFNTNLIIIEGEEEKLKIDFQYQRFYLRYGLCGLFVILWMIISQLLADIFSSPWVYWFVCAIITITIITIFSKLTNNISWFNKIGSFEKTEAGYILTTGKIYLFKDVKRLCA